MASSRRANQEAWRSQGVFAICPETGSCPPKTIAEQSKKKTREPRDDFPLTEQAKEVREPVRADPILDEIHRVREELVKKHGGFEGYMKFVQKLDRAHRARLRKKRKKSGRKSTRTTKALSK
jgi:hypothetical protein